MYSYIKGELTDMEENKIIVEAGGIGYGILVPSTVMDYMPSIGEAVKVYTYLHVKEDAFLLFGFLTKDDLKVFQMLLSVNGIGPKGALAILSVMATDQLRFAILAGDAKAIAKAPGVGGKTAQRVILELKDKMKLEDVLEPNSDVLVPLRKETNTQKNEAIEALVALGYSASEALGAVSKVELMEDATVEDILKAALKQMAFL